MKKYKHFKGSVYEMLFEAEHSETKEKMIVYRNEHGKIFVRPSTMFFDTVEKDGEIVARFQECD